MTDREKMKSLLQELVIARARGDYARLRKMVVPDVTYHMVGQRIFSAFAGTHRGWDAVQAAIRAIDVDFEYSDLQIDHVLIDGDHAVVRWHGHWRNRGTSASAEFEGIAHLVFEGELVKEYTNFVDTAGVANLANGD